MDIIVQKFGGTSVSTEERRKQVIKKISKAIESGLKPVVVVSAMGRAGEPYATDTLLSLVDGNFKENNKAAQDLLMCCGEIISSVVMCNDLYKHGITAVPLTGGQAGIITNSNFTDAQSIKVDTTNIMKIVESGKVPVITGFQGVTENGFFTTLGRGGSDTSACILGVALKAKEIAIYTDVDGIMTADPRVVEDASLINEMTYNEVFQLADHGAKVIHPKAVEIAKRGNVPLVIKNTMSECKGTVIKSNVSEEEKRLISGITHLNNRIQVRVRLSDTHTELAVAVRAHKPEIDKLVVEKIESARAFRELGVPLGFFFLSECILRKNHTLEYIFELKHPSHSGAQGTLQEK